MADDFDPDDEYGKTVMSPSPFFQQNGKPVASPPPPAATPRPAAQRVPDPEPPLEELFAPRRRESAAAPRPPEPRSEPARGSSKRMMAPMIAGAVLSLGVGIAAGIFIAGNGAPIAPPSAAPAPLPVPTEATALPPPAAVTPPPVAALPPSATAPTTAPITVPPTPPVAAGLPPPQPTPAPAAATLPPPPSHPDGAPKDEAVTAPKVKIHRPAIVQATAADATPHGKKSYLVVKSIPGVKVLIDNKAVGITPVGALEVTSGGHSVTLIAPDGRKKGYQIDIGSGDSYDLSENF